MQLQDAAGFCRILQDASDAICKAAFSTEERLQAVSLACDDDGHDAPQPVKSVKPQCDKLQHTAEEFGNEIEPGGLAAWRACENLL